MPIGVLNPFDAPHTTATRPAAVLNGLNQRRWFSDALTTELTAQDLNGVLGMLRYAIDFYSIGDVEGDDTLLQKAIQAGAGALSGNTAALQALVGAPDKVPFFASNTVMSTFTATSYSRGLLAKTSLVQWQDALGISAFSSPNVIAFSALPGGADQLGYFTDVGAMAQTPLTPFARTLLDDTSNTAMRATLGVVIGTNVQGYDPTLAGLATLDANLGLVEQTGVDLFTKRTIGVATAASIPTRADGDTRWQLIDATLTAFAALTGSADKLAYFSGLDAFALTTLTAYARSFLDDADSTAARLTLGLGALATKATVTNAEVDPAAAISLTKLAGIATLTILGNNTAGTAPATALTGAQAKSVLAITSADVAGLGALATKNTIADVDVAAGAAIAYSKLATVAANRLLGNNTGTAATPLQLTTVQVKTMLGIVAADVTGLGALATLDTVGTAQIDALAVTAAKLANGAVTMAKNADMAAGTVLGRDASLGVGVPSALGAVQLKAILNLVAADITGLGALATQNFIFNSNVDANAGIAISKLGNIADQRILANNTGGAGPPLALGPTAIKAILLITTADVIGLGALASKSTIADADVAVGAAIALSKLNGISDQRLLGNVSGAVAPAAGLTVGQVKTFLSLTAADVTGVMPLAGGTLTGEIVWASASIPAAPTVDIGASDSNWVTVSAGTGPITSFGAGAGLQIKYVRFNTSVVISALGNPAITTPTGGDITTQIGDVAIVQRSTVNVWRIIMYQRADGTSLGVQPLALGGTGGTDAATARANLSAARNDASQTLTGQQTVTGGNIILDRAGEGANPLLALRGDASQNRIITGSTGSSVRWAMAMASNVAESGGNAGSNFYLQRYTDFGVIIDIPFSIERSTGKTSVKELLLTDNLTVDTSNYDFFVDNANARAYFGANAGKSVAAVNGGVIQARVQVQGTTGPAGAALLYAESALTALRPVLYIARAGVSGGAIANGNDIGSVEFEGHDGTQLLSMGRIGVVSNGAVGTNSLPADMTFSVNQGAAASIEVMRLKTSGDLAMGPSGGTTVIDSNRVIRLRSYTFATIPAASTATGMVIWVSDLGGTTTGGPLVSDGTVWKRMGVEGYTQRGNVDLTLNPSQHSVHNDWATTLTANRTATLGTTGAYTGARFRIKRSGLGAFTLAVVNGGPGGGTLYTFPSATGGIQEFIFNGTDWILWS